MSYGTDRTFKSKKALRERIAEVGAERVGVFGTSMFGNEQAVNVAELRDGDVIVGPNVYSDRRWYAAKTTLRDGTVTVK